MDISKQSLQFQQIVSTSQAAPYQSTTSYEYGKLFSDLSLIKQMHLGKRWQQMVDLTVWQPLLRGTNLVVRKTVNGQNGGWLLAMGDGCGSAAPAWPLVATEDVTSSGESCLVFFPDMGARGKKLHFICLFDIKEWEGCCVAWLSPSALSFKFPQVSRAQFSIMMAQVSEIQPLLTLAARYGFLLLNITALKAIAQRINVEVELPLNSLDLFDLCWHTVRTVLHPCSPSEILDAEQHRLIQMAKAEKVSAHEVFMGLDEGLQLLSRDDEEDVRKNQKKQRDVESKTKVFSASYKAATAKHKPLPQGPRQRPKPRGQVQAVARGWCQWFLMEPSLKCRPSSCLLQAFHVFVCHCCC